MRAIKQKHYDLNTF